MSEVLTVVRRQQVPRPLNETWLYLTEPALLSKWFANVDDFTAGAPFRFDFGDGDYFAGQVFAWEEPRRLGIHWQFMGLGPGFDIEFALSPLGAQSTEVTVQDRGALSADEAASLGEGWEDFLARLASFVHTGEPSRYEWSQVISATAWLRHDTSTTRAQLRDLEWWRRAFPSVQLSLKNRDEELIALAFQDAAWADCETEAAVTISQAHSRTYVTATHEGWTKLPPPQQVSERRRYAGLWEQLLRGLERTNGASQ